MLMLQKQEGALDVKDTNTPVYCCPMCALDAPHTVAGHLAGMYAICCTNCRNGSLVCEAELRLYQMQWEDELREIIAGLDQSRK